MIRFQRKLHLSFIFILCIYAVLLADDSSLAPPEPTHIDKAAIGYFDSEGDDLVKRIEDFTLTLHKYESIGNSQLDTIITRIRFALRHLMAINTVEKHNLESHLELSKTYELNDLLNLYHLVRKTKLNLKSLHDEEKENQRGLDAANETLDRELQFYQSLQKESPEKIECGFATLYNVILVQVGKNKDKFLKSKIAKEKNELDQIEKKLSFAKEHVIVPDSQLVALKNDAKLFKNDWLTIKNAHQEKEADLILDNQEAAIKQEILKSSLNELNAKQKFLHSEIKFALANLLKHSHSVDKSILNQKISSWDLLSKNLHQTSENWLAKLNKSIHRYGEALTLNVNDQDAKKAYSIAQENLLFLQSLQSNLDDMSFWLDILKGYSTHIQGNFSFALHSLGKFFIDAIVYVDNALDTTLFYIGITPVTYWGLLRFSAILLVTLFLSRFLIRTLSTYAVERKKVQRSVIYRLSRLLHYLVLTIGILLALSSIGFDFSNLLLIAGALGVGLGFGLQSIFNNFISGLIMLFESQLKIGDFIEVAPGVKGEIREINVRSTLLTTPDGVEIIVPNAEFISNRITNWTFRHTYRRLHIPFSVSYDADLKFVQEVVGASAKKMPDTLIKPGFEEPQVVVTKLSENSIDLEVVLWVSKNKGTTQSDYLIAINNALKENSIQQPFPQRDLHIASLLGAKNLSQIREIIS